MLKIEARRVLVADGSHQNKFVAESVTPLIEQLDIYIYIYIYIYITLDHTIVRPYYITLDHTIRIGSTPTFLYFDLYLYSAYAAHYVYYIYIYIFTLESYMHAKGLNYPMSSKLNWYV